MSMWSAVLAGVVIGVWLWAMRRAIRQGERHPLAEPFELGSSFTEEEPQQ